MKNQEQKANHVAWKSQVHNEPKTPCHTKSLQFRSIAPKAPAVVSSPGILSCQPSSALSEASATVSSGSIVVPAQNYALMQVAGQEGTFSLVALSPSVSAQPQKQQLQKNIGDIHKNLKLPIPRYQSSRIKHKPENVKQQESRPTKTPQKQVKPCVDPPSARGPVEPLKTVESVSPDSAVPEVKVSICGMVDKVNTQSVENAQLCSTTLIGGSTSIVKPKEESANRQCLMGVTVPQAAMLSSTVFSKPVQFVSSPPKGKLPILPYSKVKGMMVPLAKLKSKLSEAPPCIVRPSSVSLTSPQTPEIKPIPTQLQANTSDSSSCVMMKSTGKKRVRKRKTFEDMLTFEARKKRCLSFTRRRTIQDKVSASTASSKEKAIDISKKYRSIRPKPLLVMESAPQLVALSSISTPQSLALNRSACKVLDRQQSDQAPQRTIVCAGNRQPHRCVVCSRCFRFRHHLQSHMRSHCNSRSHMCPTCRKGYASAGSLGAHIKLHHAEGRPRTALRCQFCDKSFGYVGVYFGHLREVHKVVLTVEPSISHHEDDLPIEGLTSLGSTDEQSQEREDPVELQIKCGRCQATTPTFADMRLHLMYVHGENVPARPVEEVRRGYRQAEDELVKHAAHYWRELNQKRCLVAAGECEGQGDSSGAFYTKVKSDAFSSPSQERGNADTEPATKCVALKTDNSLNCVLCSRQLDSKEELLDHWRDRHQCEDPAYLWTVLRSFLSLGSRPKEEESF